MTEDTNAEFIGKAEKLHAIITLDMETGADDPAAHVWRLLKVNAELLQRLEILVEGK